MARVSSPGTEVEGGVSVSRLATSLTGKGSECEPAEIDELVSRGWPQEGQGRGAEQRRSAAA